MNMKKNIYSRFSTIRNIFKIRRWIFKWQVLRYQKRLPLILSRISTQECVNIIFFCDNIAMWKYEGLFKLLLRSPRFSPIIVPFLYPKYGENNNERLQNEIYAYCLKENFPYREGYNFQRKEYSNINNLNPDVIIYTQPYNLGYKNWLIKSFWDRCIFVYTPYCFPIENIDRLYNTLLQNICWRLFLPTELHCAEQKRLAFNKGKNVYLSGYPLCDLFKMHKEQGEDVWKIKDCTYKRVIWAPHHSILDNDVLHYSNFLRIADELLLLTQKYVNTVQFAFKPHPFLRPKLYKIWGVEKTDNYYKQWDIMVNTMCCEEEYIDLFIFSDGLVHDSSSFMAEYIYTMKPSMFIYKQGEMIDNLNMFAKKCLDAHYKGNSIQDIDIFIKNVILQGDDPQITKRQVLYDSMLPPNNQSVAMNIYNEINTLCNS